MSLLHDCIQLLTEALISKCVLAESIPSLNPSFPVTIALPIAAAKDSAVSEFAHMPH